MFRRVVFITIIILSMVCSSCSSGGMEWVPEGLLSATQTQEASSGEQPGAEVGSAGQSPTGSGSGGGASAEEPVTSLLNPPEEVSIEAPSPPAVGLWSTVIVDTGQGKCYDDHQEIPCPEDGEAYYGQDAQYAGVQPIYMDNGEGTVTDLNTGLMWVKTPGEKLTYAEALAGAEPFELAGYDDWRLPTIKELYSLIDFSGSTGMSVAASVPYIDTDYFDFEYGNASAGERHIDAQYWSGTEYVGTVFGGQPAVFGVNFADGRIKGYPRDSGPGGSPMVQYMRYVRGNPDYGDNDFVDNGDGAIIDLATGLTWQKCDSGAAMNWEDALAYCEILEHAGYDDWRLPNAKELHSIVDYTRAPDAAEPGQQGPAIDPIFDLTESESWFWTSTTHLDGPNASFAVYVTFGQAFGVFNDGTLVNVHGVGAQRSSPKSGDPDDWTAGHGPQNDEIRIYNYARCVRGGAQYVEVTGSGTGAVTDAQPAGDQPPGSQPPQ